MSWRSQGPEPAHGLVIEKHCAKGYNLLSPHIQNCGWYQWEAPIRTEGKICPEGPILSSLCILSLIQQRRLIKHVLNVCDFKHPFPAKYLSICWFQLYLSMCLKLKWSTYLRVLLNRDGITHVLKCPGDSGHSNFQWFHWKHHTRLQAAESGSSAGVKHFYELDLPEKTMANFNFRSWHSINIRLAGRVNM